MHSSLEIIQKQSESMLLPRSQRYEPFKQRAFSAKPVVRCPVVPPKMASPGVRQHALPSFDSQHRLWTSNRLGSGLSKDVSCHARSEALDIDYVHPPRDGRLESSNLRDNVREQVWILHSGTAKSFERDEFIKLELQDGTSLTPFHACRYMCRLCDVRDLEHRIEILRTIIYNATQRS